MEHVRDTPQSRKRNRAFSDLRGVIIDRSGIAATEFAMLLPIMALIFFGMLEASDAMMTNRRVANAANSLVDLVGQETEVTSAQVESIFTGVQRMLEPTDSSTLSMSLASVTRDPEDESKVIVEWSLDDMGEQPYAEGSEFTKLTDDTILLEGVSLIVAELEYEYDSGLTSKVVGSPITFRKISTRWPRKSPSVVLTP